jgi:hypothetical protein
MTDAREFRRDAYRVLFVIAGAYNLAFGAWAGLFPGAFFRWFDMEAPRYPSIWGCLGMVVGVYGLLYLHAARRLEEAWPIIAVGLLGKVLGPVGLALTAARGGDLPLRMLALLALNDLVWWVPFGAFLLEGKRGAERVRAAAPYACAALHAAAGLAMLFVLRGGTEAEADPAARAAYVSGNAGLWRAGFAVWMAAGMSVLAFYAWWAPAVRSRRLGIAALVVAGAGLACDLLGEALYVGWLPWLAGDVTRFVAVQRSGTVLTAVFANGFYTVAGIMLTLGTPGLPRHVRALAWIVWTAGIVLSVCGAMGSAAGLVASSGILFPALVLLALAAARALR